MTCICDYFNSNRNGTDMNGMPEHAQDSGDWKSRLQIHGVLWKRSTGQSKWMRRFVVVRDGWLLYYPETERKDFARRNFFNIHPKAAVPLGLCNVSPSKEQGQPFSIIVSSDEVEGKLTFAAENDYERDKWIDILEKSKRITWANQHMSDGLIRQLEEHGLAMAKQKQDYFDRLQSEVLELADEKEKTWELEKINDELEKEKARMESFAEEMKTEYDKVKSELEDMQTCMKTLDEERSDLFSQLSTQEEDLSALEDEKEKILTMMKKQESALKRQESFTEQLSHEKQQTEQEMRQKLHEIEEQTQTLLREKSEAEMRLQENTQRAHELEEEKEMYNEQAHELQATIKDLKVQKEMTEAELKEEVMARMEAERRLREAESSVRHLGHAVENETPNIHEEVKEQMVVNVNKLKYFFENLAQEAKVDPDRPIVMKNAIHARKTIVMRNKTRKFERRKSSSMRAKSLNMDQILLRGSKSLNPRRAQSTFVRSNSKMDEEETSTPPLPPLKELYTEQF